MSPFDKTTITISCSENVAYCLGSDRSTKRLIFGPLSHGSSTRDRSNTQSRVLTSGNKLKVRYVVIVMVVVIFPHSYFLSLTSGASKSGCVRGHPKMIRLATSLLSHGDKRDFWLGYQTDDTELYDYHVIFSMLVDSNSLESKFIAKNDSSTNFHQMLKSTSLLSNIKFKLLDENCKQLAFNKHTLCKIGITLAPYKEEDS